MNTLEGRFAAAKEAVALAGPRLAELKATTILALVTLRIQRDGLSSFKYSTEPVPTFFFEGRELNAAGKVYIEDNDYGTWGGFRAAQGLSNGQVDLTYTGRMFRSLTVAPATTNGATFTAPLTASDEENANKVNQNIKRYGNFLVPNRTEETEANAAVVAEINRIVANIFAA